MLETLTQQWKSYQLIRLHSAGMTEGKNLSAYDYTLTSGVVSRRKIKSVTHFWISYSYHIFLHNNRNDEAETHACLNETFADLSSLAGVTKNRQRTEKHDVYWLNVMGQAQRRGEIEIFDWKCRWNEFHLTTVIKGQAASSCMDLIFAGTDAASIFKQLQLTETLLFKSAASLLAINNLFNKTVTFVRSAQWCMANMPILNLTICSKVWKNSKNMRKHLPVQVNPRSLSKTWAFKRVLKTTINYHFSPESHLLLQSGQMWEVSVVLKQVCEVIPGGSRQTG